MKELTIEITNNCANKCVHCPSCALLEWDLQGLDEERGESEQIFELTKPEVIRVLDENPVFDKIRFSGGEPFMHPLLLEFLREAKKRRKYVEVLTSGNFYFREQPFALINSSREFVDRINISLYGNREVHDNITRNEGSFDCLDATVDRILGEKINFSFNFVAMSKNKDALEDVFRYVCSKKNDYCNPGINILRIINQGFALGEKYLFLLEAQVSAVAVLSKELSRKYNVPVSLGCSFAETFCNAGNNKRIFTYNREYFDCSALKGERVNSREIGGSNFLCQERWGGRV